MDQRQRELYNRFPANLTQGLLRTQSSTAAYLALGASFRESKLTAKDREAVILRVAKLSDSAYERMQHLPIALEVGWSASEIVAIEEGEQIKLDPRTAALLQFTDECVTLVRVTNETFAALVKHYSEQEIAEITLLIGHYMMTARFIETLGIDLDTQATSWEGMAPAGKQIG
jgi:alkylhydroperoxidase family enzyme